VRSLVKSARDVTRPRDASRRHRLACPWRIALLVLARRPPGDDR
jgi:hypothetical protein